MTRRLSRVSPHLPPARRRGRNFQGEIRMASSSSDLIGNLGRSGNLLRPFRRRDSQHPPGHHRDLAATIRWRAPRGHRMAPRRVLRQARRDRRPVPAWSSQVYMGAPAQPASGRTRAARTATPPRSAPTDEDARPPRRRRCAPIRAAAMAVAGMPSPIRAGPPARSPG